MTHRITSVRGRVTYNSRGSETIEVDVTTDNIHTGRAAAPSGASVGKHEAVAFPPGGPRKCLDILADNTSRIVGMDPADHAAVGEILHAMDGTGDYSKIGGSLAYAVSVAAAESAAKSQGMPLYRSLERRESYHIPVPLGNVLGGGAHAGKGTPDIQEILVCALGARSVRDAIRTNIEVHRELGDILAKNDPLFTRGRGDEGGWAPRLDNEAALEVSARACESLGYALGKEVALGVDFASSTQYDMKSGTYVYDRAGFENDPGQQVDYVSGIIQKYRLKYAEDVVHEEDFEGMAEVTAKFPDAIITGDDLTVTSHAMLRKAASQKSCSGAILKVNQAGSLHDAMLFAREAQDNGIKLITSHRSGESNGSHMSHIGIATGSVFLKAGVVGGERVAKLNELIRVSGHDLIRGMAEP